MTPRDERSAATAEGDAERGREDPGSTRDEARDEAPDRTPDEAPDKAPDKAPGVGSEDDPYDYPRHWEADVVLSDGGTVRLRPIVPDDADRIVALHGRLSERTRYFRYFGAYPRIPPRDLTRFTVVDHHDRVAFVAVLGTEIVAVGRYERLEGGPLAEVAFVVDDAHQGRGLGSILLEHLAAAGAECGIDRFAAEVLGENSAMLRVFREAGYEVTRRLAEGGIHLEFDIDPTEESLAVARSREQAAEARSMQNMLHPRSVAVIGASTDRSKIGYAVLTNLLSADFAGTVYPVNPEHAAIRGVRTYASVVDIPDEVDLAVVAVPAEKVEDVLAGALQKGVTTLVIISAGFGESGSHGMHTELRVAGQARAHGMRVVGPNALGVLNTNPAVRLNATLAPRLPPRGHTGFFCQSGALGIAILDDAEKRGLGLSTFVSAGNRADVSGNDLLQYWETDTDTDTVLLYLESFGNPRKFARLARRLARSKPIVAVRSGRRAMRPQLEATSARIDDESVQALFEQTGVIRVESLDQLFDTALVLAHQPLPSGSRVAIVGNSAAIGALAADTAFEYGLALSFEPVDVGAQAEPEEFGRAVRDALADPNVDALVVVFVPPLAIPGTRYAREVREAAADTQGHHGKPIVSTFLAVEGIPAELAAYEEDGAPARGSVPSYPSPERAVMALARAVRYAKWRGRQTGSFVRPEGLHPERAQQLVRELFERGIRQNASEVHGEWLSDAQCGELMSCYGIDVVAYERVSSEEDAVSSAEALGYPVAVKSAEERLRRSPDLSGARLDVHDADAVRTAYRDLREGSGTDEVYVQRMGPRGSSCAIGLQDDPSFGSLVSFGLSGTLGELIGDRAYRAVPLTDAEAEDLVREPRTAPLLSGYNGGEPADLDALAELVLRVAALAEDVPEVRSLALDPVIATREGATVVGARIMLGDPPSRPDSGPRQLRPIEAPTR